MFAINSYLLWAIAAMYAVLLCGTLVRMAAIRGATADVVATRLQSLRTWWILFSLMAIAVVSGRPGIVLLLLLAALFGLREFCELIGWQNIGKPTVYAVFAFVPLYYGLVLTVDHEWLRLTAPVFFLITLGGIRALSGTTEGYIRTTAALFWGLMLLVYCPSYACFLFDTIPDTPPQVGSAGWVLFLVLLTETDDIIQAVVGRRFGRTRITPRVSPNKSLEGLLGGIFATVLLAVVTAPMLTCLTRDRSFGMGLLCSGAAGLLISTAGFVGDINMSAVKRDAGVKDGSSLLPGQGGMIDRIDSLTFSAPVFYYFVRMTS